MNSKLKLLLLFSLLGIVFYPWFFTSWPNLGSDLSYDFEPIYGGFPLPWIWRDTIVGHGLGMSAINTLWSYPVQIIFQLALKLNIPFWFQMKYMVVLPMLVLAIYGIYKLSKLYKANWFIASTFYLTNTYFLLLVDGGQLNLGLAYTLLPLSFYLLKRSLEGKLKSHLLFGFSVWVLGAFDVRITWMLGLLIGIQFLFDLKNFTGYIKTGFIAITIFILLNFYWILPSMYGERVALPRGYESVSQLNALNFTSLVHSIFLLQPHWYKNVFGKVSEPIWYFAFIPMLAFSVPIFMRKNKGILFFTAIAGVSVFLAKGSNPPFGEIYQWLFAHFPGFNLFRDSTKFFFLVAFSYSVLIGIFAGRLSKRFNWKFAFVPLLLTSYFLFLIHPVWFGKMTGTFVLPNYQAEIIKINGILKNDRSFGRVLWIPTKNALGYFSPIHTSVDAFSLLNERQFAIGTVGTYETFNFLREAPYMGELFDIAGMKYIAYPFPDTRREELKKDNIDYYFAFLNQLKNLPWIDQEISDPPVAVLKTKSSQDRFFIADTTLAVAGSDDIYNDLIKIPGFKLANNALVFLEEDFGLGNKLNSLDYLPNPKMVSNTKNNQDLAVDLFVDSGRFFFPSDLLDFSPNKSGWWKRETADFLWWRNFLQEKYSLDNQDFDYKGGWAIAEGEKELQIADYKSCDSCVLLARTMESTRGGRIDFYQGPKKLGEIYTRIPDPRFPPKTTIKLTGYGEIPDQYFEYNKADFLWSKVGKVSSASQKEPLVIKTKGDINVINALVFLPETLWDEYRLEIYEKAQRGEFYWYEWQNKIDFEKVSASQSPARVSYDRISPTHYRLKIQGLEKPSTLVFSESYDSNWRISVAGSYAGTHTSYPVYSLVNGFLVEKNGDYDIYFYPQKYVIPGLIVSVTALAIIILILLVLRRKNKNRV